jgi:cytochrome c553
MRLLRWAGYGLAGLGILLVIAAGAAWGISSAKLNASVRARPEHLVQPTPAQLADAERQARTLGCFSCHGEGLRGYKMFDEPNVGTIWAPNLTRVAAHATDQQLAQAIRQGISDEGHPLFIMPSEVFQHLTDQEVSALIAMIRQLPRGGSDTPENVYGPLGRLGLAMGKFKNAPDIAATYAVQEPIRIVGYDAGRRLAVLNCSGCHNADLAGKEVKPGERSPDLTIVLAYDPSNFETLLKTGRPAGGQKLRLMGRIARSDLSHMTGTEIDQLYAYLRARASKLNH